MQNKQTEGALFWNVEKIVSKGDYKYAVVKDHPKATKHGYVLLHRIIMENHLGRLLNTNEVVHHIDENKFNNQIENLQLLDKKEHVKLHVIKGRSMVRLCCPQCKIKFTREKGQTHLTKNQSFTCCSNICRGKFSRKIQLYGITKQVESAISENILSEFNSLDNTEETILQ